MIVHLIEEGHRVLREERENAIAARLEAVRATSGILTDAYEEGYLERLREDWPE